MSEAFEQFTRLLKASVSNISQSFYDSFVETNTKLRTKAGYKEFIIRRQLGKCCDWCSKLAGTYEYGNHPNDIFKRHENCRCMVTHKDQKGTYTDVWSKKEYQTQKEARLAREQEIKKELDETSVNRISVPNLFDNTGARSAEELQKRAEEIKTITDKYTNRESKWKHKLIVNNAMKISDRITGRKLWSCKIEVINKAVDGDIVHEMLHSYSASYAGKKIYSLNKKIEEASVEYLAQEICKAEGLTCGEGYAKYVSTIKKFYKLSGESSELQFATDLFNQPLKERKSWLAKSVSKKLLSNPNSTSRQVEELEKLLKVIKKW